MYLNKVGYNLIPKMDSKERVKENKKNNISYTTKRTPRRRKYRDKVTEKLRCSRWLIICIQIVYFVKKSRRLMFG